MIELFTSETPNGRKIAIMLQEINYEYKIKYVSLGKGDQFKDDFIKRCANEIINRVPGINRVCYDITSKPPGTIEFE